MGETFTFLAHNVHVETCPSHFKLSNLPSQTTNLHYNFFVKKKMLVKLCGGSYETSNDLVNVANGIFQNYIEIISKTLIWIQFQNFQIHYEKNGCFAIGLATQVLSCKGHLQLIVFIHREC